MTRPRKYHTQEELAAAKRAAAKRWRKRHPAAYVLIQHRSYLRRKNRRNAEAIAKWEELLVIAHRSAEAIAKLRPTI